MDIQPYVLRYWETEFEALAPGKSKSGQRVYTEHELGVIRRIKELLYDEGYTIAGAKKRLQAELEDGRSFAPPEAEGELFESDGGGEDEPPVIALAEAEPAVAPRVEPEEGSDPSESPNPIEAAPAPPSATEIEDPFAEREARRANEASGTSEQPPVGEIEPMSSEPGEATVDPGEPAPFTPAEEPPAAAVPEPVVAARPSRRRKTAAELAPQPSPVAPQPSPIAVDSALSNRVETLEHGLRRVLDEVRQLRGLLADPGDR